MMAHRYAAVYFVAMMAANAAVANASDRRFGRLITSVDVTNEGNVDASGQTTIQLYASTDQTLDGGDALLDTMDTRLMLRPGQSRPFRFNLRDLPALPADDYYLLADIDMTDVIDEVDEDNNVAITDRKIRFEAFADVADYLALPTGR